VLAQAAPKGGGGLATSGGHWLRLTGKSFGTFGGRVELSWRRVELDLRASFLATQLVSGQQVVTVEPSVETVDLRVLSWTDTEVVVEMPPGQGRCQLRLYIPNADQKEDTVSAAC